MADNVIAANQLSEAFSNLNVDDFLKDELAQYAKKKDILRRLSGGKPLPVAKRWLEWTIQNIVYQDPNVTLPDALLRALFFDGRTDQPRPFKDDLELNKLMLSHDAKDFLMNACDDFPLLELIPDFGVARQAESFYALCKRKLQNEDIISSQLARTWLETTISGISRLNGGVSKELLNALFMDGIASQDHTRTFKINQILNDLMLKCDVTEFLMKACLDTPIHVETATEQATRLNLHFHREFKGLAVERFVKTIPHYEAMYDLRKHYGRIIPIVQSSGTGKSRLVEELGYHIPSLSVCFRRGTSPAQGWPPSDSPAYDFLKDTENFIVNGKKLGDEDMMFRGEEIAAAFLGAWTQIINDNIEAQVPGESPKEWFKSWYLKNEDVADVSRSQRHELFAEVAQRAGTLLDNHRAQLRAWWNTFIGKVDATDPLRHNVFVWHGNLFLLLAEPGMEALANTLIERGQDKFILAFDECTELDPSILQKEIDPPLPGISLIALQRILKASDGFHHFGFKFWYLLLDTNSALSHPGPTEDIGRTFKLRDGFIPLPTWPYLGYDQMANQKKGRCRRQGMHSGFVTSLCTAGRYDIVAEKKLFQGAVFNPMDPYHVIAVFSQRVLLELGTGESSSHLATESVRSHMHILLGVVNRLTITEAPSEPLLAVAAAKALNSSKECYKAAMETLLKGLVQQGTVLDRGLEGGLCIRLLFTLTGDEARVPEGAEFLEGERTLDASLRPIRLSTFLKRLLGKNLGVGSMQYELCYELLEKSSNVWINFTHLVQVDEDISEITTGFLSKAWCRGAAVQCAFSQSVIDGFFVGYAGDLDEPFDERRLVYVPWQTKAKVAASGSAVAKTLVGPWIVSKNGEHYKPEWHVVILMDFGTSTKFKKPGLPLVDLTFGKAAKPGEGHTWGGYARNQEDEYHRYCLNIRGRSVETYPVIKGFENRFDQLFQRALSSPHPEFDKIAASMKRELRPLKVNETEDDKEQEEQEDGED
ncbi:hypothetical protein EW146_g8010 [Bondarzewia mesenterica]|uniref:Uncharacterized protein n=1 Tax=Bondarzewia mesenterica TaxID=1095465 RepID=A0A4S4LJH2_9AGAM|nr:hypothetical protein EW146_g8010 [Bondarzewia mesenterica]